MRIRDVGGTEKPVLLLIHGGGVAGWMWDDVADRLVSRFRLLIPDLPGHDHSSDTPFADHASIIAELAATLEELPRGSSIAVAGFSLGGQIAVDLAASHPDLVPRVVVISSLVRGVPLPRLSGVFVALAAPFARRRWFARLQARALFVPDQLFDDYLRTARALAPADLRALTTANARFRIPDTWPTYPGRALLLAGAKEPRSVRDSMRDLGASNPRTAFVLHHDAGHGLPLQDPDWVCDRLEEFILQET